MDVPTGILWELSNCDFVAINKIRRKDGRIVFRFWNSQADDEETWLEFTQQDFDQWIEELKELGREMPEDDDWEADDEESD